MIQYDGNKIFAHGKVYTQKNGALYDEAGRKTSNREIIFNSSRPGIPTGEMCGGCNPIAPDFELRQTTDKFGTVTWKPNW